MTESPALERETHDGYYWTLQECPVCEMPPTKFVGKRGGAAHRVNLGIEAEIWSCRKCGLIFPNPMPFPVGGLGQHYEVEADDYFQSQDKDIKLDSARDLVQQAEKNLGRKGRLLDVGIGRGETLIEAKASGWDAEGVEPSHSFADYAEKRIGVKIWRQAIENTDIPQGAFDVVILNGVLEHLYDPDAVVKKISEVLRPGGLFFVHVPNEQGLYLRLGNFYQRLRGRDWTINLSPTFPPFHVFGFGPKALRKLLRKHGLEPGELKMFTGYSLISSEGSFSGLVESVASRVITAASTFGEMGTYMETWAVKK